MISLWTAASGMESMKFKIEVIANNLANTNTDGFKRTEVDFNDLLYQYKRIGAQNDSPTGTSVGLGVRVAGTTIQHKQGSFKTTENQMDLCINGPGFFRFLDPISGNVVYSRNGAIKQDDQGRFVNSNGYVLDPAITLTADQLYSHVSEDGRVWARQPGTGILSQAGQVSLSTFPNPAGLQAVGNSSYMITAASGAEITSTPKSQGLGSLISGSLESSNVQIVHEMVDLITTQKAFDTNSKAVTVSDKMMDTANNLTR